MGVEYSLVKVKTAESYCLGKTAMRQPQAGWQAKVRDLHPIRDSMRWLAVMQPSPSAMWRIGTDDGNMTPVVLTDRWTAQELADLVGTACFETDEPETAMRVALDMLEWAGRDEVILMPDDARDAIEDRFGLDPDALRVTRSLSDAVRSEGPINTDRNHA